MNLDELKKRACGGLGGSLSLDLEASNFPTQIAHADVSPPSRLAPSPFAHLSGY